MRLPWRSVGLERVSFCEHPVVGSSLPVWNFRVAVICWLAKQYRFFDGITQWVPISRGLEEESYIRERVHDATLAGNVTSTYLQ